MIAKLIGVMSLGAGLFLGVTVARADHNLPIEYHEPLFDNDIGVDQVYEASFPTEIVPNHGKLLTVGGSFYNLQSTEPINFTLWLNWFDARLPGGQQSSPPESYEVLPGGQTFVNTSVIIPFTPERIGVHIQNDGPGAPLVVAASLDHTTTTRIPEPSAVALSAIGLLATVTAIRRTTSGSKEREIP